MKTIKRSTCALTGRPIRLVCDRDAYAVIVAGESQGFGFDAARAELAFDSLVYAGRAAALREITREKPSSVARVAAAALAGVLALSFAVSANAEPKAPRKPTVCAAGAEVSIDGKRLFACTDGKRPKLFVRWRNVRFTDSEGKPAAYVLGWTS